MKKQKLIKLQERKNHMKKLGVNFFLVLLLASFVAASSQDAPECIEGKVGECVELWQYCDTCTYSNLDTIIYPNQTQIYFTSTPMTKTGKNYNYTFCDTDNSGKYIYVTTGDKDGQEESEDLCLIISPTGQTSSSGSGLLFIGQIGMVALFFGLGRSFPKEKWKVRGFFDMFALLMGIITLNSIRIIGSETNALGTMGEYGLIVGIIALSFVFLYMFIYALIEVFHYFKEKNRKKWTVSDNP